MEATKRAGRPEESTPEERELLVKIRNEARKKYDVETNKKHTCRFCKKDFFKHRFGSHIFKKHPEELKKMFAPFAKIQHPTYPYGLPSFKPCFVCHQVWEHDGHAEAHTKKNAACSPENQLKAMYAFLGCEPPADALTIRHNHPLPEKMAETIETKAENDSLTKMLTQCTSKLTIANSKLNTVTQQNEAMRAQVDGLKAELKAARAEKQRIEARENYYKRKAFFETELLKEQLNSIITYLRECDKDNHYAEQITETTNMTITEEETAELEKLRDIAKLSVDVLPAPTPNDSLPAPPVDVPPILPPEPKPAKKILSIREQKAAGIYAPKPAPVAANTIEEPETQHKYCKICAGTDEFYDLKECGQCYKTVCVDNQIKGCQSWDCSKCAKQLCYPCVKKNGTNKLKPLCSSCVGDT
jgi:hypothetical protein